MKFLQKLGKALMLPVAVLPICGILMGIGYWLCPATMQGGDIHGAANLIGLFLVKAGGALIDNMATTIPANQARRSQTRQPLPTTSHIQSAHGAPSAQRSTRNNRSIQAQVNTLPPVTVKHSKKSPRGVQRGRGFAAPLRFSFFLKKILCAIRQKSKRHTVFKKKYF